MSKIKFPGWLTFSIAGLLCLSAAYLLDPTLGAVSSLPFIIVFPSIAYLLYRKGLHIVLLCSLGGALFKAVTAASVTDIVLFGICCGAFAAASVLVLYLLFTKRTVQKTAKYCTCIALFSAIFVIFHLLFGTFYGNLSSKEKNEAFLKAEYPDIDFTVGSTYYSAKDSCYLTDIVFRDKEVYSAKISAEAKIDGYRDYCEARLLEHGTTVLKSYLESNVIEGEHFALRRNRIITADRLTAESDPEKLLPLMTYDIAFYRSFADAESFEEECRLFAAYIPDAFRFWSIRFYGIGQSGNFEYQLDLAENKSFTEASSFDGSQFSRYFSDNDTHRFWSVIK